MDDYWSTRCKAMCPASCTKCHRLRTELDLRDAETKYENEKSEIPSANKEPVRSSLYLTGDAKMKTCEFRKEPYLDAPKCPLCKLILPQIRNLVRDISIINIQDIPGICDHCRNINSTIQCKKCDSILRKYMQEKECYVDHCNKECHEVIARIKTLLSEFEKREELSKLRSLSLEELLKFMKPLKKSPNIQQKSPDEIQEGTRGFKSTCVCEDLLKKLQEKVSAIDYNRQMSHDQLEATKTIEGKQKYGKKFIDRKIPSRDISYDQLEKTKQQKYGKSFVDTKTKEIKENKEARKKQKYGESFVDSKTEELKENKEARKKQKYGESFVDSKTKERKENKEAIDFDNKDKSTQELKKRVKKSEQKQREEEISKTKGRKSEFKKSGEKDVIEQSKDEKKRKSKKQIDNVKHDEISVDLKKVKVHNKSDNQLEKMILSKKKGKREPQFNINRIKFPVLQELPPIPVKILKEPVIEQSESTLECERPGVNDYIEVIKGNRIVRYKRGQHSGKPKANKPLFFNVSHNFGESLPDIILPSPVYSKTKSVDKIDELFGNYRLSNKKYIENGWTVLPTLTFVRRLNIYKMVPSDTKMDWLGSYRNHDLIFYETGEVLAEVYDNGLFKWFYRDGNVALDFVDVFGGETNATKEYVIYDKVTKTKKSYEDKVQTLGSFDDKGHGVVYDGSGCTRIRYNQDEGVLFDRNIGSPCHWKWNTLNEPPKVQAEHTFEYLDPLDLYIAKLEGGAKETTKEEEISSLPRSQIQISSDLEDGRKEVELSNVIREKSLKILMNYKPFEIRSKIFKLNDYFSLRMLGQSKIYILFRDGKVSLKINVGMKLISNEVIDIQSVRNDILYRQEKTYKHNEHVSFKRSNTSLF